MAVKSFNARTGLSVGAAPIEIVDASGTITPVTGTTTIAPIRFTAGTNLTAAVAGSVEYDGSILYITITGNTRKSIAYLDSNITGNAANITGTLAVSQGGTGATSTTGTAGSSVLSNTPTITTPVIDSISASSVSLSTAALYGNLTTGTLTIGGAITTGIINIATGADTAKVVNIGTTSTTTTITGITKLATIGSGVLLYTTTGGQILAATGANVVAVIGATAVTNATNATNATTSTNIAGGATGSLPYQSGSATTTFLAAGTTSQVLVGGASAPSWSNTPTLTGTNFTGIPNAGLTNSAVTIGSTSVSLGATVTTFVGLASVTSTTFVGALTGNATSATTATHVAGGTTGAIVYQTGAGASGFISAVAAGSILASNGTSTVPVYTATPSITTSVTVPLVQGTSSTGGTLTLRGGTDTTGTIALNAAAINSSAASVTLYATPTTVNAYGAATALSLGATTGTTTVNNNLTITGSLIVNGSTTTLNDQTLVIEDKNIELGKVSALDSVAGNSSSGSAVVTGLASTNGYKVGMTVQVVSGSLTLAGGTTISSIDSATQITLSVTFGGSGTSTTLKFGITGSSSNGSAVVTGMLTTIGIIPGMNVTVMTGSLTLGATTVLSIDSTTQITLSANFGGSGTATSLTFGGSTDATANGGGITLKGATDKTIIWDSTNTNFTSTENWNIATGKVYKINNVSMLSATALGSTVVGSSLTSVGNLTNLTVVGQITSQVSTGTAPFVVASTTQVANLNAATAGSATTATTATNVAGGAIGQLVYQTGSGATGFVAVGTSGQLLQSAGGAIPVYTTATYPSVATGTGTILRANGTNWVASTATFATSYGASEILYSNGANTVAGLTTANNGVLVTSGTGVPSISSTLPAALSIPGLLASVSATVSAAGTTQGTGTALTSDINIATTVASGTGVVLPAAAAGRKVVVVNKGANALLVYPASGAAIDALSANIAISVAVGGWIEFNASSTTQWYSTTNAAVATTALTGTITNAQLANSSVTIGSTAVALGATVTTFVGLSSVTSTTFVGALTGNASTVTTNANLTGPITSTGNATAVTNNAITNAMLAQMATLTIKGNNTGGTANATDLTVAQVNAILPVFTSALNGLVPFSSGGTTNFLRADGTWTTPGGGGTVTSIADGSTNGVTWTVATRTTTPVFTFSLGAITPSSVVASGSITAGTGGLIAGSGTTTSDILTAGSMHIQRAGAATTAAVTLVNLDTWAVATYRSAKYVIQVLDTVSGNIHITEILLIRDNSNNVYLTEYGTMTSASSLVTFSADYDGSANVRLRITPASTNSTQFKFTATIFNN